MGNPRHRLYVDESGDHTSSDSVDIGKRYLGLCGVMMSEDVADKFRDELDGLKRRHLNYDGDDPPILHRVDILNHRGPFSPLHDKARRDAFDADLLALIKATNFTVIAVVLDKVEHGTKKYRRLGHPYHYCLLALMERYCGRLAFFGLRGDLMAESRGGTADHDLRNAYHHTYENGAQYLPVQKCQATLTSKHPKIKPKSLNIAGLQLADVLAHPLTRDVLVAYGRLQNRGGAFADAIAAIAATKYNRQLYQQRINGYGRVFLA